LKKGNIVTFNLGVSLVPTIPTPSPIQKVNVFLQRLFSARKNIPVWFSDLERARINETNLRSKLKVTVFFFQIGYDLGSKKSVVKITDIVMKSPIFPKRGGGNFHKSKRYNGAKKR